VILLDTSVLVYAVGSAHPLRAACRRIVEAIRDGWLQASTTAEVIHEFAQVRARGRSRADARRIRRRYLELLSPVVLVEERDVRTGLDLLQRHHALGAFDAVLAAVAINRAAEALISTDAGVRGLRHVDPATPELDRLLARARGT
jgi:hypothetical protein